MHAEPDGDLRGLRDELELVDQPDVCRCAAGRPGSVWEWVCERRQCRCLIASHAFSTWRFWACGHRDGICPLGRAWIGIVRGGGVGDDDDDAYISLHIIVRLS